ncbi:MAG: polysaccharide pyruvyl transferase family protein [Clostridia bacterium]|nr:polysaccharide pyruvyl transferase family protein [Clostridia bacterium]
MNILMLTDRMDAGGAETHIVQLIRGLRRMGNEVTLLSGGGALADALEGEGVRVLRVPLPSHSPWRLWKIRRTVFALVKRERFELLHAHARIPALLIRGIERMGCATVVSVHAHFRTNALLARLCNWGERTVAVSEDLRTYVCETYGVPAERVRVIPNGIDCERFSPPVGQRSGAPRILFASRLDADCSLGADLLCDLAPTLLRRFAGASIEIAGGGSEYHRIFTRAEEINRLLGRNAVTLRGWVHDMPALLRRHDIFVGVSRAAMEAGACGCAVILCGNEGYGGILSAENAAHAQTSNFCARGETLPSAERLEGDLVTLLEAPMLRQSLGEVCRGLIAEHFSAARMCRETLALYHRCVRPRPRFRVTVGGYFGCGNTGDDAILLGFLEGLHAAAPEVEVTALTGAPWLDRRRFGVRCVWRKNPIAVRWAVARSDLFLCGGGSLLQNLTSGRSLSYYLALLRMSQRMGKPTALYAAGIGPLFGDAACRRVARVLGRCRYVSLRDGASMRLLSALGVDAGRLHLGADPALLMPLPPRGRGYAILSAHGVPSGGRFLCVVLRGGTQTAVTRALLMAAVRMVCRRARLIPLFPVFDELRDGSETLSAIADVGGHLLLLREPADAAAILSCCDAAVTMRLHALILATAVGTPTVGIPADAQDAKIASFAKEAGQEYLALEHLSVGALVEAIELCLTARRSLLADTAAELRRRAQKDIENVVGIVNSQR